MTPFAESPADLAVVDLDALDAMFPSWEDVRVGLQVEEMPRCSIVPFPMRGIDVGDGWAAVDGEIDDADVWMREIVARDGDPSDLAAFDHAFPERGDVSDHDRRVVGAFARSLSSAARDRERAALKREFEAHATPTSMKVDHVRRARQTRSHGCHWPGCDRQVPPAMWGCAPHWYRLPKRLRDLIWRSYRIGQETTMSPSREYIAIAREVDAWIREHGGRP